MKTVKIALFLSFLLYMAGTAVAQDVILKKDNSTVLSKVIEVTSTEIKYKKWNNQDGPTYSIGLSEINSVTYQNGEVEKFAETNAQPSNNQQYQQPQNQQPAVMPRQDYVNVGGYMEADGGSGVKLNGVRLTDEEVRRLVGEQVFQTYLKGKREESSSYLCLTGSILTSLGAGICFGLKSTGMAVVFTIIDAVTFVGWLVLDGNEEMKEVASIYNLRQGNYFSFNIAPSLKPIELPQMQNSHALGLTLSMNF